MTLAIILEQKATGNSLSLCNVDDDPFPCGRKLVNLAQRSIQDAKDECLAE